MQELKNLYLASKFAELEIAAKKFLKLNPDHETTIRLLAISLINLKKGEEAKKYLMKLIKKNNKDTQSIVTLATLLKQENNTELAANLYIQAISKNPTEVILLYNAANLFLAMKNPKSALNLFKRAAQQDPNRKEIYLNSSIAYKELGDVANEEKNLRKVIGLDKTYEPAVINLLNLLRRTKRIMEAMDLAAASTKYFKKSVKFQIAYGNVLRDHQRFGEATKKYLAALALDPRNPATLTNLATVARDQNNLKLAEDYYLRALNENNNYTEAKYGLAQVAYDQRRYEDAKGMADELCEIGHENGFALKAKSLLKMGLLKEAVETCRNGLRIFPNNSDLYYHLGTGLRRKNNYDIAELSLKKSLELNPNNAGAYNELGVLQSTLGRKGEALEKLKIASALDNKQPGIHLNIANCLADLGHFSAAIESYKKALQINPGYIEAWSGMLFSLNYYDKVSPEERFNKYEEFAKHFDKPQMYRFPIGKKISKKKVEKTTIGYISADFCSHVAAEFLLPILKAHDKNTFKVLIFANDAHQDLVTEKIKKEVDDYFVIEGMHSEKVADLILENNVDFLIDLSGHTKGHRLDVMALRPAPIQATWFGYGYTTGLPSIDYYITDKWSFTEKGENLISEKPLVLDYLLPFPERLTPEPFPLPCKANGFITFGSLTRTIRLNDTVIEVWSKILKKIPNSKLRLDQKVFLDESVRQQFIGKFSKFDVDGSSLILGYSKPHWSAFSQIDICLDPFPHNGGTTTYDALWMGVPVVTMRGDVHMERIGHAVLSEIGLENLSCERVDQYIETVVNLSENIHLLEHYRNSLRSKMKKLQNYQIFTKSLEEKVLEAVQKMVQLSSK